MSSSQYMSAVWLYQVWERKGQESKKNKGLLCFSKITAVFEIVLVEQQWRSCTKWYGPDLNRIYKVDSILLFLIENIFSYVYSDQGFVVILKMLRREVTSYNKAPRWLLCE